MKHVVLNLAAALVPLVLTFEALACSPVAGARFATLQQKASLATFAVEAVAGDYRGNGVIQLRVLSWLKGSGGSVIDVGGFRDREGAYTSCDDDLRIGQRVLVFLAKTPSNEYVTAFPHRRGDLWFSSVHPATPDAVETMRRLGKRMGASVQGSGPRQ